MKQERLMNIIHSVHVSEKAVAGSETGSRYVFCVASDANKNEVREAVEKYFSRKVTGVRIVNVKGKPRRFGKFTGRTKGWKKAYVSLESAEPIDFSKFATV